MSKQLKRKSYRLIMAQVLSLTLVASPACNRVTPEKETGKTGAGEVGGTLANKPTTTEEAVLPGTLTNTPDNSERGPLTSTNEGAAVPISANNPAPRVGGPPPPGIEIEAVPGGSDSETAPTGDLSQRLGDRSFVKLELPNAALAPDQLLAFLADSDRAVHDLTIAWNAKQLSEKEYLEQAKRLSLLKMQASERLYNDKSATQAQQKTAIAAQVESLSQLTGLGDVSAAQKLLTLAGELTKSPDTHLAHQGRLVLLGFRLNQLVEGQIKDPQVVLEDVNALLDKSEYRGAVELLALQQGLGVLGQLGYAEQAQQVQQRIVKEFRASPDRELAMRAWSIEVGSSPELKAAIDEIKKTLAGEEQDATKVATAAAEFIRKFPTLNTVYFFLQAIVDLEYRGFTTASRELSKTVVAYKTQVPTSPLMDEVDIVLEGHNKRLGLLNQSLVLKNSGAWMASHSIGVRIAVRSCWSTSGP